jgi:hypothetical protein
MEVPAIIRALHIFLIFAAGVRFGVNKPARFAEQADKNNKIKAIKNR